MRSSWGPSFSLVLEDCLRPVKKKKTNLVRLFWINGYNRSHVTIHQCFTICLIQQQQQSSMMHRLRNEWEILMRDTTPILLQHNQTHQGVDFFRYT